MDDSCEEDFDIFSDENGTFKTNLHIPRKLLDRVVGANGAIKERIETETKTIICIPTPAEEFDVSITGSTKKAVFEARKQIEDLILEYRRKHRYTHFLCVPFNTEEIMENFKKFKNDILAGPPIQGVDEIVFQKPQKLHLTLGLLTLLDQVERNNVVKILQECEENVMKQILQKHGTISLNLKELEIMNKNPASVDVLYGKIESEPMFEIIDGISDYFKSKGVMHHKNDKLHVTLMNTKFKFLKKQKKMKIDGRPILEMYKNISFGVQTLTEIHLSDMSKVANNGFYGATGVLKVE